MMIITAIVSQQGRMHGIRFSKTPLFTFKEKTYRWTENRRTEQVWSPNVRCVPTPSSPLVTTVPPHHPSSPLPPPRHPSSSPTQLHPSQRSKIGVFEKLKQKCYGRTDRRTDPLIEMRGRI